MYTQDHPVRTIPDLPAYHDPDGPHAVNQLETTSVVDALCEQPRPTEQPSAKPCPPCAWSTASRPRTGGAEHCMR